MDNLRGEFAWVDINLLNVPRGTSNVSFQRDQVSNKKVEEIARNWSWALCGTLTVVRYPDGKLDIAEGGHRKDAAMARMIESMPCMIYAVKNVAEAAGIFRQINLLRTSLHPADDQKAALIQGDPISVKLNELILKMGRTVSRNRSPHTVNCVRTLQRALKLSPAVTERVLMLMKDVCAGTVVDQRVFGGLFQIEEALAAHGTSLGTTYRDRCIALGADSMNSAILNARASAGTMNPTHSITMWRDAILRALNRGQTTKIDIAPPKPVRGVGRPTNKAKAVEIASQVGRATAPKASIFGTELRKKNGGAELR
jgi:hypothetical protein